MNTGKPIPFETVSSICYRFEAIKKRSLKPFDLKRKDDGKNILAKGGENSEEVYKDSKVMLEETESEGCTEMKRPFSDKTITLGRPHKSNKNGVVKEHPNSCQLNFTGSESASDDSECYQDLENEKHENVEN